MPSNALWGAGRGQRQARRGVTATVTAELRPNTAGSWVRVANGGGVEPRDVNAVMQGNLADERVLVSRFAREYSTVAGEAFSPPTISEIRDSPPTPSTVLDVVHRSGSARRMTALVAGTTTPPVAENGDHFVRPGGPQPAPGRVPSVTAFDGSDGGDQPWTGGTFVMLSEAAVATAHACAAAQGRGAGSGGLAQVGDEPSTRLTPLGSSFEFLFEPLPGCETCGVPTGTTVYAHSVQEPELAYGDWEERHRGGRRGGGAGARGLNVTRR